MARQPAIRQATVEDIPHLIYFRLQAHDGMNEALYENLQLSVEQIIEAEMKDRDSLESFENYWLVEVEDEVAGGMHIFPFDWLDEQGYNPVIPKDRLYLEAPFEAIPAPGTFYIHALTVYPEHSRKGIASALLEHAQQSGLEKGYQELSLYCVEENGAAVSLYEKRGFKTVGRQPMPVHPLVKHGGDVLLMIVPTEDAEKFN